MVDLVDAVVWWDKWQLRVLVLGSLILQWFLLLAAPMRKYVIPRCFRTCIWLAYVSSDALAIYALATLFNRHARDTAGGAGKASPLEVLWAPILLIHLGGQRDLTAYGIEDNELWTRHTVTLVSQVTVAVYAFYKAWPSTSDRRLLASAILLFIAGFLSFCEKPWALYSARINRLAAVSSMVGEPASMSKAGFCFTELRKLRKKMQQDGGGGGQKQQRRLSERDKVHMILSDLLLYAAVTDLHQKLEPLAPGGENVSTRWLRKAFGLIYTRANVVTTPAYMAYHVLLVPSLHAAVITLFAAIPKHGYEGTDVKMTYVLMCLTAALDLLAVCIRGLLFSILYVAGVPPLCETIPEYNFMASVPYTGRLLKCATFMGFDEGYFDFRRPRLYGAVKEFLLIELVKVGQVKGTGFDLSTYRSFSKSNWILSEELRDKCGRKIKRSLRQASFDKSVLIWHIATNLCYCSLPPPGSKHESRTLSLFEAEMDNVNNYDQLCAQVISNYMAHLLNSRAEMLMTGSRKHLMTQATEHMERIIILAAGDGETIRHKLLVAGEKLEHGMLCKITDEAARLADDPKAATRYTLLQDACELAKELMGIEEETRWRLVYRVWVGMLCYSASMCRGYLHAKSLGEGGEFLSIVWLIISLKGGKTLADKLQMPEPEEGDEEVDVESSSVEPASLSSREPADRAPAEILSG